MTTDANNKIIMLLEDEESSSEHGKEGTECEGKLEAEDMQVLERGDKGSNDSDSTTTKTDDDDDGNRFDFNLELDFAVLPRSLVGCRVPKLSDWKEVSPFEKVMVTVAKAK